MQRMRDQLLTEEQEKEVVGVIAEFKSNFVSMRVPKDTDYIFTNKNEFGFKNPKLKNAQFFFFFFFFLVYIIITPFLG
jgi:hypothetical protein